MKRIIIIGCGGAGKSTLARQLGQKLDLPVVHLDKLFWRPGWVQVTQEEFDSLHRAELAKEKWIIDGNFNRTMEERLARCDTVIYLDFSRWACLWGVVKRDLTAYGTVRPDMGEGCPERIDFEFLKWVWNFNKNKRERYYRLLNETTHAETIVLRNRRAVKMFLKRLYIIAYRSGVGAPMPSPEGKVGRRRAARKRFTICQLPLLTLLTLGHPPQRGGLYRCGAALNDNLRINW